MKGNNSMPSVDANNSVAKMLAIAVAMLGFALLVLGSLLALVWLPLSQLAYRSMLDISGLVASIAAGLLGYNLIWRPYQSYQAHAKEQPMLPRAFAMPLYALVERMINAKGSKLSTKLLDLDIYLADDTQVTLHVQRHWYGKLKGLEFGIGFALFSALSEAEMGALIAHELGHIRGKSRLRTAIYQLRQCLVEMVSGLDDSVSLLTLPYRALALAIVRASAGIARQHELAADAWAAKLCGSTNTRCALEKSQLIASVWSAYLDHEVQPALNRGVRVPVFEGFRLFCKPGVKRAQVQTAVKRAESYPVAEFDTHPSLEQRVAALVAGAKPACPPLSQCLHLLNGELAAENAWYEQRGQEQLSPSDWDQFGTAVVQAQIQQRFAGHWMDPQRMAFADLVQMTQRPEDLWERVKPAGASFLSLQGKRNYVLNTLEEWIIACLIQRGFILKVVPGQALVMERAGKAVQPAMILQAALSGKLRSVHLLPFD